MRLNGGFAHLCEGLAGELAGLIGLKVSGAPNHQRRF
jgi:hypothetical protein